MDKTEFVKHVLNIIVSYYHITEYFAITQHFLLSDGLSSVLEITKPGTGSPRR